MQHFDIPVCLIIFKRSEKGVRILQQIAKVRPRRLYLLGDGPRSEEERAAVEQCRREIEAAVTWDCEIVRNYAEHNRGVFENIAGCAKWVLEREECAIFLEDDNYPEETFFEYCRQMLHRYRDDDRVLWVCGTNYMTEYVPEDGSDYMFTRLMLPCGWGSWSHKFARWYEDTFSGIDSPEVRRKIRNSFMSKRLGRQNLHCWGLEVDLLRDGLPPMSWDYQMAYSLCVHDKVGIAPRYNQIRNIGIDEFGTHGTGDPTFEMTKRYCEIPTRKFQFPLRHPAEVKIDRGFTRLTEQIMLWPRSLWWRARGVMGLKRLIGKPTYKPLFGK